MGPTIRFFLIILIFTFLAGFCLIAYPTHAR